MVDEREPITERNIPPDYRRFESCISCVDECVCRAPVVAVANCVVSIYVGVVPRVRANVHPSGSSRCTVWVSCVFGANEGMETGPEDARIANAEGHNGGVVFRGVNDGGVLLLISRTIDVCF